MQCERLLDYIAILNNKTPKGHLLLVAAPDTHQESQIKIRIAAEVAFETVDLLSVPWPVVAHTSKVEAVNYTWYQGMIHATRCYQNPVLYIEPDCVPLRPHWLEELALVYYDQPKRYLGSMLSTNDGKIKCLSRVAIYPRGAGGELKEFCAAKLPFEVAAGNFIIPRAGKSRLFQQSPFSSTTDRDVIRDDAVLLHSDKESVLLSELIEQAMKPITIVSGESNGADDHVPVVCGDDPEPSDRRTRAWKEWRDRQPALTNS